MDTYMPARLYRALHTSYPQFCAECKALLKYALTDRRSYRFVYMWYDYGDAISKIGQETFTNHMWSRPQDRDVEGLLNCFLHDGYTDKLRWIIRGMRFLLLGTKTKGYRAAVSQLNRIEKEYVAAVKSYLADPSVKEYRQVKMDFLCHCYNAFAKTIDLLVEVREKEQRIVNNRGVSLSWDRFHHPRRYKIRMFFRKMFSKKKKWRNLKK